MNDVLEPMVDAWTLGGPVSGVAPPDWKQAAGADGDVLERRLLAIAAQATDFAPPAAPTDLAFHAPLPRPGMPIADARIRNLMAEVRHSLGNVRRGLDVFSLLEARGVCPHPADIRPTEIKAVTPAIAPLLSWWAAGPGAGDLVTAAFLGTASARALDPEAGAAHAAQFFDEGTAAVREAALMGMATGLSGSDRDLLLRMSNDPSSIVRAAANELLSATGGRDPEKAAQATSKLIESVSQGKKGVLATLTGRGQKSDIRLRQDAGAFAVHADARSLAAALSMPEEEIAPSIVFERHSWQAFESILTMLAVTGSRGTLRSVMRKAIATDTNASPVPRLMQVLDRSDGQELFVMALAANPDLVAERAFPDAVTTDVLSATGLGASDTVKDAVRSHSRALWTVAASCDVRAAAQLKTTLEEQGLGPVGDATAIHAILDLNLNLPRNIKP